MAPAPYASSLNDGAATRGPVHATATGHAAVHHVPRRRTLSGSALAPIDRKQRLRPGHQAQSGALHAGGDAFMSDRRPSGRITAPDTSFTGDRSSPSPSPSPSPNLSRLQEARARSPESLKDSPLLQPARLGASRENQSPGALHGGAADSRMGRRPRPRSAMPRFSPSRPGPGPGPGPTSASAPAEVDVHVHRDGMTSVLQTRLRSKEGAPLDHGDPLDIEEVGGVAYADDRPRGSSSAGIGVSRGG